MKVPSLLLVTDLSQGLLTRQYKVCLSVHTCRPQSASTTCLPAGCICSCLSLIRHCSELSRLRYDSASVLPDRDAKASLLRVLRLSCHDMWIDWPAAAGPSARLGLEGRLLFPVGNTQGPSLLGVEPSLGLLIASHLLLVHLHESSSLTKQWPDVSSHAPYDSAIVS